MCWCCECHWFSIAICCLITLSAVASPGTPERPVGTVPPSDASAWDGGIDRAAIMPLLSTDAALGLTLSLPSLSSAAELSSASAPASPSSPLSSSGSVSVTASALRPPAPGLRLPLRLSSWRSARRRSKARASACEASNAFNSIRLIASRSSSSCTASDAAAVCRAQSATAAAAASSSEGLGTPPSASTSSSALRQAGLRPEGEVCGAAPSRCASCASAAARVASRLDCLPLAGLPPQSFAPPSPLMPSPLAPVSFCTQDGRWDSGSSESSGSLARPLPALVERSLQR